MQDFLDQPFLYFVLCFVALLASALLGKWIRKRRPALDEGERDDLNLILSATLTLVSLIIGFSFSMAINRYDDRKKLESHEAAVIRVAYERAEVLPNRYANQIQQLLRQYVRERIALYASADDASESAAVDRTFALQRRLWEAVKVPAVANQTDVTALAASGINDVAEAESATQAAWRDHIPLAAWVLMVVTAMFSCALVGYYEQPATAARRFYIVLPALLAIALFMIADLDSTRSGPTMVRPVNLERVARFMH